MFLPGGKDLRLLMLCLHLLLSLTFLLIFKFNSISGLLIKPLVLENGFKITVDCLSNDILFCNVVEKEIIKTGIKISKELSIFTIINVKAKVLSFNQKGDLGKKVINYKV